MTDVVDSETRSRMMSGIRGKDTRPELEVRHQLHHLGFRYRLHDKKLPGRPDIVLKRYNAVIFIHGCFWHRHNCRFFKWPKTRQEFWRQKINRNHENDIKALKNLQTMGWRVCIVWECSLKRISRDSLLVSETIARWLESNEPMLEISE
ncbi:MAG: DNA mismatch endonuclease Vsr [Pseudomonadales bacterium]|nr:DNA mismatch endonuclease Vsr [Pseudomonadales bacterium]MCP5345003.1 DNA mismatch endonuclease Vsr [Pseudomonadales bacterium]